MFYNGEKIKFFTNGEKTIKLKPGDEIPDGFYIGRTFNSNPWNKGLTAETDERVKSNGQATKVSRLKSNNYKSWNTGLTKETDDRLKDISKKISDSTKGRTAWNKGIPASEQQKQKQSLKMKSKEPWNKGLTKELNKSIMSTSQKLKGHECFVKDWELAKQKEYITKKNNKSFNSSKPEEELIKNLISIYGKDDVIHPYRDERYPFNCDAYIKSEDLFIELNGTVEHNGRPFDRNSLEHLREAESIKLKAESKGPSSRYWNIYKWWTQIDPLKLETFRKNNLNFKIIYPNNLIITK